MWLLVIPVGLGILALLFFYDRLTEKEYVLNAIVTGKSKRAASKDAWYFAEGGSSFLYDQISRDHYYVLLAIENSGEKRLARCALEVDKAMYEYMREGAVIQVRCVKGKIFGMRIKGLA